MHGEWDFLESRKGESSWLVLVVDLENHSGLGSLNTLEELSSVGTGQAHGISGEVIVIEEPTRFSSSLIPFTSIAK